MKLHLVVRNLIKLGFFFFFACSSICFSQAIPSSIASVPDSLLPRYIQDEVGLIKENVKHQISLVAKEIENTLTIRVFVRTEYIDDQEKSQHRVESFFSEWIRTIGLEKRGILFFALLPRNSLHGMFFIRVGIGLKYLITHEMGEKILNRVILPSNLENNDGKGFLEGILAIKTMLIDELKVNPFPSGKPGITFSISNFLWNSKEIGLALLVAVFLGYLLFFIERCPRCNGVLRISSEILKEPGKDSIGLRRKNFACESCGFNRRKKEAIYPSNFPGFIMWLLGKRQNLKIKSSLPDEENRKSSSDDRRMPPE
ncbi:MAG: hypothetical protein HQM08_17080 [Candidatus Riflebacteria bacterium]|nr:hypothetical protein [Candidatus Riflebacteria bacterium]